MVGVLLWRRSGSGTRTFPPGHVLCPRGFSSGCVLRTDASQPDRGDKIDLDLWKSVMKSQMDESPAGDGDGEGAKGPDSPDGCVLAATRELVSMWRQAGKLVPDKITEEEVQTLAELSTKSGKKKYLKYLAIREGHKKKDREKREKRRSEKEERFVESDRPPLKNSFLVQYRDHWLDRLLGWRGVQAMQFGQPLVYDMSYEQHMTPYELANSVSQMMEVEGTNRRARDPFHLHLCNLQPDSGQRRQLVRRYGADAWDRLLVTETPRRHVDLFPRERLVYLTADSPHVLRAFDPDAVYVVGALVDRSVQTGLSFANAKRLQLATARLPLDRFLRWETGAKTLTLDQMVRILLAIKDTGSWEQALDFVPKRKHDGFYAGRDRGDGGPGRDRGDRGPGRDRGDGGPGRDRGDRDPGRDRGDRDPGRDRGDRDPGRDRGSDRRGPAWGDQGFTKSFGSSESGRGGQDRGGPGRGVGWAGVSEYKLPVARIRPTPKGRTEDSRRTDKTRKPWYEQD
ncbi:unnamed protein product [Merluccius merluccius]